jgi:hypothetical protein
MSAPTAATDWASSRGLSHVLASSGDISMDCPQCKKGKLIVQAANGWFFFEKLEEVFR